MELKRRKMEAEIRKTEGETQLVIEQTQICKLNKCKRQLEILKLEKELDLPSSSSYQINVPDRVDFDYNLEIL